MKLIKKQNLNKKKRGAALVEYGLLVAGVAMTTAVAVSILGHKTNDLLGTVAAILPGSDTNSAGPIRGGQLLATQQEGGAITLAFDPNRLLDDVYGGGDGGVGGAVIDDPSGSGN